MKILSFVKAIFEIGIVKPVQALFKNKIIGIIVVAVVIGGPLGFFVFKEVQKNAKKTAAKKTLEEKTAHLEKPSEKPLSPSAVIEREKKILELGKEASKEASKAAEPAAGAGLQLEQKAAPATTELQPVPVPPGEEAAKPIVEKVRVKAKAKKTKETPALIYTLKTSLEKAKEGALVQSIKELESRDVDVVEILRGEIISNYGNPVIRKYALLGLFYTGKEEAIPIIKTVLKVDPDEDVQLTALFVLDALLGKDAIPLFDEMAQKSSFEKVRSRAQAYSNVRSISR